MTLSEIAKRSLGKANFKFKREDISVTYHYQHGHIYNVDKKDSPYHPDQAAQAYDGWIIVCDHPKDYCSGPKNDPYNDVKCSFCGRDVETFFRDKHPSPPEKLSPVKMTKQEPREEELRAHMAAVRSVHRQHGIFIDPGLAT